MIKGMSLPCNRGVLLQTGQPLQHFAFERHPMIRIAVIGGEVCRLDVLSALRFNRLDQRSDCGRQTIVGSNHQQREPREARRRIADAERLRIGRYLIRHGLGRDTG